MKKLIIIFLLFLTPVAYGQQKPMLGRQVDGGDSLADGSVGLWLINEGSGNRTYDLSGNGQICNLVSDPPWVAGKYGTALDFDGSADFGNCGVIKNTNVGGTIIVWCRPDTLVGTGVVASFYASGTDGWGLWRSTEFIRINDDIDNAGTFRYIHTITADTDYMFAAVMEEDLENKLYVNGVLVGSGESSSGGLNSFAGALYLAARNATVQFPFGGKFDMAMMYNRALTASEIADLYEDPFRFMVDDDDYLPLWYAALPTGVTFLNQVRHGDQKPMLGVRPYYESLVGAYAFNEDSGDRVYDTSGNDNTGSLISLVTWVPGGLNFAGDDDYIDVGTTYQFTSEDFTIMIKFRHDDAVNPDFLFGNGIFEEYGIMFQIGNNQKYLVTFSQAAAAQAIRSDNNAYTVGEDAVVAFVRTGTLGQIYHNGKEVSYAAQPALTDPVTPGAITTRFGINVNGLAFDFEGVMYWAYIFDSALSADEIEHITNENYSIYDYEQWYTTEEAALLAEFGQFIFIMN